VLGHAHDITAQVMMEEALKVSEGKLQAALENEKSLSRVDFLTGIPNRRMFYQTLSMEGKRSRRYLRPLTVVYIDVDNFKQINDLRGHAVGDDLLKLVGTVLESTVRSTDTAARLGGDEFAVLLPESDEQAAAVIVAKLQDNLQTAIRPRGWPVTFSFGVVTFPIALDSTEEMIKRADEFMYEAKRSGKSAVVSKVIEAVAKSS
jgi:diguanylate cyclase (GGDEF)-like protein